MIMVQFKRTTSDPAPEPEPEAEPEPEPEPEAEAEAGHRGLGGFYGGYRGHFGGQGTGLLGSFRLFG